MTPDQLDAIERAARAATPGPWRIQTHHDLPHSEDLMAVPVVRAPWPDLPHGSITIARCGNGNSLPRWTERQKRIRRREESNASFIAMCSPEIVLALVARARRAEELEARLAAVESIDERERARTRAEIEGRSLGD